MAKRLVMEITYADGRGMVAYPVTPKLQMSFESNYKVPLGSLEGGEITKAYQLAWLVQMAHKEDMPGGVMPGFEDWSDTLEAVEVSSEDIRPFGPAAPANGSRNSVSLVGSLPTSS